MQWYWKGDFVRELTDAAIEEHLRHAAKTPSELSLMHLYPDRQGGARGRIRRNTLGRSRRHLVHGDRRHRPRPAKAPALKSWAKAYWEGVHPTQSWRRLCELHVGR